MVYEGTGVALYTEKLVKQLLKDNKTNELIFFLIHPRAKFLISNFQFLNKSKLQFSNCKLRIFPIPVSIIEFIWNKLHIFPLEWLIGNVDVVLTSDWLEPPVVNAKKVTTIHDLSVLKYPETFDQKIIGVHSRKLKWVKKESTLIMCDSIATKNDAIKLLKIEENRLKVVYPGI